MLFFVGQQFVPHSGYRQKQAKIFSYVKTQGNFSEFIDNRPFNSEATKCTIGGNLPICAHGDDFPSCDKEIRTK
jgi:hypothetical protein